MVIVWSPAPDLPDSPIHLLAPDSWRCEKNKQTNLEPTVNLCVGGREAPRLLRESLLQIVGGFGDVGVIKLRS